MIRSHYFTRVLTMVLQISVQYKTTGVLSATKKLVKTRNIEEIPDIDVVDHPANRLSPFFIQQSVDVMRLF